MNCFRCGNWPCDCKDGQTIIHGDCREVLPELGKFDLLLTDPPYGMNLNTDNSRFSGGTRGNIAKRGNGIGTGMGKPIVGDDIPFDPQFMLDSATSHVIWGWNHFSDKLPQGGCLVWIKRFDAAFGTFLSDAEIAWKSNCRGVFCHRDLTNNAISRERQHPTQKPLTLFRWCLGLYPKASTILDPFMGSGTTLRAAKDLGRKCTGIELEERYCEIAANRLRQEVLF